MWKTQWHNTLERVIKKLEWILRPPNLIDSSPDSKVHGANMGPSEADRTQVSPMLAPWTLLFGQRLTEDFCLFYEFKNGSRFLFGYT